MTRWKVTVIGPSGYGPRVYTEQRRDAEMIARLLGTCRVERQYKNAAGRWHRDGGFDNVFMVEPGLVSEAAS